LALGNDEITPRQRPVRRIDPASWRSIRASVLPGSRSARLFGDTDDRHQARRKAADACAATTESVSHDRPGLLGMADKSTWLAAGIGQHFSREYRGMGRPWRSDGRFAADSQGQKSPAAVGPAPPASPEGKSSAGHAGLSVANCSSHMPLPAERLPAGHSFFSFPAISVRDMQAPLSWQTLAVSPSKH